MGVHNSRDSGASVMQNERPQAPSFGLCTVSSASANAIFVFGIFLVAV